MEKTKETKINQTYALSLVLFLLCLIPEAVFLTRHGFYWDDWSQLLIHQKYGDSFFWNYFVYDRPGSAWTHILFFPICGSSPIRWHMLFILLKYLVTILFWQVFRKLYPTKPFFTDTAAMLFAVCPLFRQEYTAIAYSQHYTDFVLFAFSLYALLQSAAGRSKKKQITWYFLSILSMLGHLSVTEYFVFLNLLKYPVLWIYFCSVKEKSSWKKTLLCFVVPFLVFIGFCLFRLNFKYFFPQFNANTPEWLYLFLNSPLEGIKALLRNMSADLAYPFTGFIAKLFAFDTLNILTVRELVILAASLILAVLTICLRPKTEKGNTAFSRNENLSVILTGAAGMALGILPFWIMNQNFPTSGDAPHADRCFIAAMPFFCLLLAWVFSAFFPDESSRRGTIAAAVLIFLFAHNQMYSNQEAADITRSQNAFYHQLTERIPGIENGTAIVDDSIIFPSQGNFATATALNILYPNPVRENGDIPIWVFTYDTRLYQNHGGFHVEKRNYHFNQPPSDYVYIDHNNKFANCVWVFDPGDTDNPHVTDLQRGWIASSNINRIKTEEKLDINTEIFGKDQEGWCSYYEQAALLRQKEDWESLAFLAHTVLDLGFTPFDSRSNAPFEWWPFIEGLHRNGETDMALELADQAIEVDNAYVDFFSGRFAKLAAEPSK